MIQFKYCLQIRGRPFSCLGSQVSTILSLLSIKGNWYLMDISTNTSGEEGVFLEFENTELLINYTNTVNQFLSGVFLLIERKIQIQEPMYTEDIPFRNDLEALLEIRTFDTSYIELYSDDHNLIEKLQIGLSKTLLGPFKLILKNDPIEKFSDDFY
mgnify:CR=1 FL=1